MSDPRTELQTLTRTVARAWLLRGLAKLGSDVTSWKPGSWSMAIVESAALVIAAASTLVIDLVLSAFVDTTKGNWLTLVARWQYGVERGTLSDVELRAMCAVQLTAEVVPTDVHVAAALETLRADGTFACNRAVVASTTDGVTTMYIARPESDTLISLPSDIVLVGANVRRRAVPLCHDVVVEAAEVFTFVNTWTLYVDRRRNRPGIGDDVNAALAVVNDAFPIGGFDANRRYASLWIDAIMAAVPELVGVSGVLGDGTIDVDAVYKMRPASFTIELV